MTTRPQNRNKGGQPPATPEKSPIAKAVETFVSGLVSDILGTGDTFNPAKVEEGAIQRLLEKAGEAKTPGDAVQFMTESKLILDALGIQMNEYAPRLDEIRAERQVRAVRRVHEIAYAAGFKVRRPR